MKYLFRHMNQWLLMLPLILSACQPDDYVSGGGNGVSGEKVQLEIFTRANSYHTPATRALDENKISMTPWVLVFKGNGGSATFVEAVQAFELVGKRYVVLTRSDDPSSKYQLLILANPHERFYYGTGDTEGSLFNADNFSAKLTEGVTTLSEVCSDLLTEPLSHPETTLPYSGADDTIPMSYVLQVDKIDETTRIEGSGSTSLELIRVVAKMVVVNEAANFTFKGITLVANAPYQGQLHNLDGSIYSTNRLTEYQSASGYAGNLVEAVGESTSDNPIYLYESATEGNDTYLIIQGEYEGVDYYYKMALVDGYQSTSSVLNIRCNFQYTFRIINARGPGYDTVQDAKVSKPSNIDLDFEIKVEDASIYEVIANNDYYLGVSNSVFIAYTNISRDYEGFHLLTNCGRDFPNSNSITTNRSVLDNAFNILSPLRIPVVVGNPATLVTTPVTVRATNYLKWYEDNVTNPSTGQLRENAYITLKLGNLEKKVQIRQRDAVPADSTSFYFQPTVTDGGTKRDFKYYVLSGYVEEGKEWIKLRPSSGADREDTDNILVDDGIIRIDVLANPNTTPATGRDGIVYLTTIANPSDSNQQGEIKRIKLHINQVARQSSQN